MSRQTKQDTDTYSYLMNAALRFVSIRLRSQKEIEIYLQKKLQKNPSLDASFLPRVCDRLRELGYIDDRKFAEWFLNERQRHQRKGLKIVAHELAKVGVEKDVVKKAFSEALDEKIVARELVQKKRHLWAKGSILERKNRLYRVLLARGFDGETIRQIVDECLGIDYNTDVI